MISPAATQTARTLRSPAPAPDQPSAYCPVPQRLITDLHDNPLAIGLYGFVARLYLVGQVPIALSVPDVLRYDPTLSRGAVLRAFARLLAAGYLIEITQPGMKTHYTPAWGRIGGEVRPWNMHQPCLGRPRHVARLRLDRRLFDICMGKLVPHLTRPAVITRYITRPVLSLVDIGCFVLALAGVPRTTPALIRIGAVRDGTACPLPNDQHLLALISQQALDEHTSADTAVQLTLNGTRKLGLQPDFASHPATDAAQPLFFVPPDMIGCLIQPLIGSLIGTIAANAIDDSTPVADESRSGVHTGGITWETRELREQAIPPPIPPYNECGGGGGKKDLRKARARSLQPAGALLPHTEAATMLQAINVKPPQIVELAHLPPATIANAIADGRARTGIRDLAGWVVSILRMHRDYGWKIAPPSPAPDSIEALRESFARYTASHEPDRHAVLGDTECSPGAAPSPAPVEPARDVVSLWRMVLATLRTQVSRAEYNTWLRGAILLSAEHSVATISAPSALVKAGLENRYAGALREAITALLGSPIQLRIVVHGPGASAETIGATRNKSAPMDDQRPGWIDAARWSNLPAMLRAALLGSTVACGKLKAASPQLNRLIELRYAQAVAELIATADIMAGHAIAQSDQG
jgi:hypothetical protein